MAVGKGGLFVVPVALREVVLSRVEQIRGLVVVSLCSKYALFECYLEDVLLCGCGWWFVDVGVRW